MVINYLGSARSGSRWRRVLCCTVALSLGSLQVAQAGPMWPQVAQAQNQTEQMKPGPGPAPQPKPQPGVSAQPAPAKPQPGVSGQPAPVKPQPGVSGQPKPQPGQVAPVKPQPGMSGQPKPQPGQVAPVKPQPGMSGQPKPQPVGDRHNAPPMRPINPGKPEVIQRLPPGHKTVIHDGAKYFHHHGHYYRWRPGWGYIRVYPPLGLLLLALPVGFATIMIGGMLYYTFGGIYYQQTPTGYVVVDPPATVVAPSPHPPIVVPPSVSSSGAVTVTVLLLNVRSGPNYGAPVVAVVGQGSTLSVYGTAPGWIYVQVPSSGQFGWVDQNYTTPVNPQPAG